jgi:hypothetical protein
VKLRFETGEEGEATAIDGNVLTLWSPRAFAPGAPIRFSAVGGEAMRSFEGRTIGSKRVGNARFEVRMRFVNLRRADRDLLLRQLA